MAAAALLAVAFANPSLYGSAFLLLPLVWATLLVPNLNKPRVATVAKALWGFACGLSAVALVLQVTVQLAYAAHAPGIRRKAVAEILQVLGFPYVDTAVGVCVVIGSAAVALVASAAAAGAAARHAAALGRRATEGTEMQPVMRTRRAAIRVSSFSLGGVVTALALVTAAFSVPTLVAVPYLAAVLMALHRWSRGVPLTHVLSSGMEVALQAYAAIHLVMLYVWQWGLSYASWLQPIADLLRLYVWDPTEQSLAVYVAECAQFAALGLFVVSLGFVLRRSGRSPRGVSLVARLLNINEPAAVDTSHLSEPLLSGEESEGNVGMALDHQHPPEGQAETPRKIPWARSLLPAIAELGVAAIEAVCANAGAVAGLLCLVSMIEPSALGSASLLVGISALLTGTHRLTASTTALVQYSFFAWLSSCYLASALATARGSNDFLEAIGVHAFSSGGPLLALAAVAAAAAAHLKSGRQGEELQYWAHVMLYWLIHF